MADCPYCAPDEKCALCLRHERPFEASVIELPNGEVVVTAADFDDEELERRGDSAQLVYPVRPA